MLRSVTPDAEDSEERGSFLAVLMCATLSAQFWVSAKARSLSLGHVPLQDNHYSAWVGSELLPKPTVPGVVLQKLNLIKMVYFLLILF